MEFALSMAIFLASHALVARPKIKTALSQRIGLRGYTLAYSGLSLVLLGWIFAAAGRAPFVPLWPTAAWQAVVALVLMLMACLLVAYAVAGSNPLSFGSRASPFDPARPGIAGVTRHPVLLALALWALAHLLANGDLAHVALFAPMGLFALAGMRVIDRRKRRQLDDWPTLAAKTALIPGHTLISGRWRPGWPSPWPGLAALAAWAALILLHPALIGPDPLAWLL